MIGQTLDRYRIEAKLGQGGMGVVYKARDTQLDRIVAIKVLPSDKVGDPERKQRFIQEAKAASALNHPNIVTVYDVRSDAGIDFIVMEYAEGRTLDHLIPAKGLGITQSLRYGAQIADALARAHEAGIVHRDLKPSNVIVTPGDRVLDFGLAKLLDPAGLAAEAATQTSPITDAGMAVGTAAYKSPEQAEGKKVDARSDIFSFGAVLYEMLTGRRPFAADSQVAILPRFSTTIRRRQLRSIRHCRRKLNAQSSAVCAKIPHVVIRRCRRLGVWTLDIGGRREAGAAIPVAVGVGGTHSPRDRCRLLRVAATPAAISTQRADAGGAAHCGAGGSSVIRRFRPTAIM